MSRRRPREIAAGVAARAALALALGALAYPFARCGDPKPGYVRPASLFFPARSPAAPAFDWIAEVDLPEGVAGATDVRLADPSLRLVSKRVEAYTTRERTVGTEARAPVAIQFIVDCSYSMVHDEHNFRFNEIAKLASNPRKMGPHDRVAISDFRDMKAEVALGWTPAPDVARNLPSVPASGGTESYTPITPFVALAGDHAVASMAQIVVVIGDLEPPDDSIVARTAEALKDRAKVYVVCFGGGDVPPAVARMCEESGGKALRADGFSTIGEALRGVTIPGKEVERTRRRLRVAFRSSRRLGLGQEAALRVDGRDVRARIVGGR